MEKKCSKCGEVKGLGEFHTNSASKDGFTSGCKKCNCESTRKSKRKTGYKYKKNPESCRRYHKKHRERVLLRKYIRIDKMKDLFTKKEDYLTSDELIYLIDRGSCFYCNNGKHFQIGLDRIDNTKGHQKNNVILGCCWKIENRWYGCNAERRDYYTVHDFYLIKVFHMRMINNTPYPIWSEESEKVNRIIKEIQEGVYYDNLLEDYYKFFLPK
jgi:hypothetical protein